MDENLIPRHTVVVGIDGSDQADRALIWAADQAGLEGRALSVVHVSGTLEESRDPLGDAAVLLRRARELVARTRPRVSVHTVSLDGDPDDVLVGASEDAVLVVVGSRGRGPVRSALLGSVGVALVRAGDSAVVVVRPHHPGHVRRGVAVGTDATAKTRGTLEHAYRLASLRGLPITVVHCVEGTDEAVAPFGLVDQDVPGLERQRADLAECVSGLAEKFPDVNVRLALAHGPAGSVLTELSRVMDITVVGRHGSSRLDSIGLGTLATQVVEHAAGAVVVVPDPAPAPA